MLKIYLSVVVALLFIGCAGDKTLNVKSGMFQSVTPEEATLVQTSKDKGSCVICGMNLVKYYKTNHAAEHDGKKLQYCSIHCLEDHLGEGIMLKNPKVVDIESLKFIPVQNAYYVVGSKKRATMSRVSKYAFLDKKMAEKFQAEFGGEIMDFAGAIEVAKKDFKH